MCPVAGLQSTWLDPLLGAPKRDPSRNREMGGAQRGWLASNSNKGNCDKDGRQTTVMRAAATATVTILAMVTATRLGGNKEGKGKGDKGEWDGNEGGGDQRGQGQQGDGDGKKGGEQVDGNGNKEGDGDKDKGGG